jgi:hypothetical protein
MRSDSSLYQRLTAFALDDPSASFKFSNRLARENGWSLAFAKGAIAEYKKFVYLAATSPTPVTPSDIVDQVWHLHLTYSRSYWDEMCGAVLGKPLHHGPTKGGASEDTKYRNLYAATLAAYRREFDDEPPRAYWPQSDARFESAAHQRWVDTRTHAVIAWRTVARWAAVTVSTCALTSAGAAFAAVGASANPAKLWTGLGALVAIGAAVWLTSLFGRRGKKSDNSNTSGDGGSYWGSSDSGSSHHRDNTDGSHSHGGHGSDSGGHSGGDGGGSDGGGSGCSSGCGGGGCSGS